MNQLSREIFRNEHSTAVDLNHKKAARFGYVPLKLRAAPNSRWRNTPPKLLQVVVLASFAIVQVADCQCVQISAALARQVHGGGLLAALLKTCKGLR
jgi:hypothetical protein